MPLILAKRVAAPLQPWQSRALTLRRIDMIPKFVRTATVGKPPQPKVVVAIGVVSVCVRAAR
jgi:hypothetical protein